MTEEELVELLEARSAARLEERPGDLHVLPLGRGHVPSSSCWCEPTVEHVAESGDRIYVHRTTH